MVEAAELAEIFQWMTPDESRAVHLDPTARQRVGEEVADVLLYLLQVADHCRIDIDRAVEDKLARNALKHPAKSAVARDAVGQGSLAGPADPVDDVRRSAPASAGSAPAVG